MMAKALVTGINGFAGTHLNNLLQQKDYEVFGTVKPSGDTPADSHLFSVDIQDFEGVKRVIEEVAPDHIYHLDRKSVV